MDTETIIIGAGFGGAVAALRLGQAGVKTTLLERGRRWDITDPTTDATFSTFQKLDKRAEWMNSVSRTPAYEGVPIEPYVGTLETVEVGEYKFLIGCGVGGGSHVYGGILIAPPKELWSKVFPQIEFDEMENVYFPRVIKEIGASEIPDDILNSPYYLGLKVFEEQAEKAGFPIAETTSNGMRDGRARFAMGIDWDRVREEIAGTRVGSTIGAQFWFGQNSGAKQTLDQNYLLRAEETGNVTVRTHHRTTAITEISGGYKVTADLIDDSGTVLEVREMTCEKLFLAAGVLGTTELLLRAQKSGSLARLDPAVGQGLGNDGDTFTIRTELPEKTNPHLGGPGAIVVMNYENPIYPCVMMRAPLPRFEQDYPNLDSMANFIFTMTPHRGSMELDANDNLVVNFDPDIESQNAAIHLVKRFVDANGGVANPPSAQITGHQLGGACMGTVCDDAGRVKGHPGLYVVDGALIPGSSTCVNPALTIAGVAERCMELVLAQDFSAT